MLEKIKFSRVHSFDIFTENEYYVFRRRRTGRKTLNSFFFRHKYRHVHYREYIQQ